MTNKTINVPPSCRACGGTQLTWFARNENKSDVQEGQLRTREVRCVFVLGCNDCSETLRVVSADKVATQLNNPVGQHQDEVIERQKNLISSLRAELAESYSLGAKIQLQPVGFLHEHFRDAQDQQTGAIAWVEESLFCLPVYLGLPVQAAEAVSERQHGIPGTSFQRLNKLANEGE